MVSVAAHAAVPGLDANADFHVEELEYRAETGDSPETWVPLRIIKPKHADGPLPTVVYLHATGIYKPKQLVDQLALFVP